MIKTIDGIIKNKERLTPIECSSAIVNFSYLIPDNKGIKYENYSKHPVLANKEFPIIERMVIKRL